MTTQFRTWTLIFVLALGASLLPSALVSAEAPAGRQSAEEKAALQRKQQQEAEAAGKRVREANRQEQEENVARLKAQFPLTPLRVEVVVSRYQGEKKISGLPYTLSVNANSRRWGGNTGGGPTRLRMGGEIPIPLGVPPTIDGKPLAGVPTGGGPVQYKNIGTSIDASASSTDDGRYQLNIEIEDTSVYPAEQATPDPTRVAGMPVFRSFRSSNELILRDGQSVQFTAATDRVSGEVVRVDVTLSVVK